MATKIYHDKYGKLDNRTRRPKHGINSQFIHLVDEDYKVMTENLAERFVDHRHIGLAPQSVSRICVSSC